MSGIALLLALCLAGLCGWSIVLGARMSRPGDERAGYYGDRARRRRCESDDDIAELRHLAEVSELDDLAALVAVLDRLAWLGVPVAGACREDRDATWTIRFRDGTALTVRTDDVGAMRRAAVISHTDPVVVSHVHPVGARATVVLWTPRHGALAMSVGP
jgi:hypothetical protein